MKIEDVIIDDPQAGIFRVHRSTMTAPEIFELERTHIFDKCWLYLGHASEVPHPGAYLRRTVAGRPLIFLRDSDGQVRAFFNTCTHRGALICRRDQGTADVFQCFYHAWTFNTKGELVGIPAEAGYGSGFDRQERALRPPPRLESYRDFYFVSFNPDIEDLVTYLAGAKEYIDLVVDQSEVGMRVVPGSNKYAIRANWKLLVENSIDGYHALPVHQTYFQYIASLGVDLAKGGLSGTARDLGNGHTAIEGRAPYGRPIALWHPLFGEDLKPEIERVRKWLADRHGEERAYRMCENFRNLLVYPNLIINDIVAITIRQFWPIAPDYMEVIAWELAPAEEKAELFHKRLDSFLTFLGPGGFATPDDVEALESCQAGFRAKEVEWSDISRGMQRDPHVDDELQMRVFWRQWHAHIQGLPGAQPVQEGPHLGQREPAMPTGRS